MDVALIKELLQQKAQGTDIPKYLDFKQRVLLVGWRKLMTLIMDTLQGEAGLKGFKNMDFVSVDVNVINKYKAPATGGKIIGLV